MTEQRPSTSSAGRALLLGGGAWLALACAGAAHAQASLASIPQVPAVPAPRSDGLGDEGYYLEADLLIRDDQAQKMTARGSVEARYQGRTLRADEVVYDTKTGTVVNSSASDLSYATGKVGVGLPVPELSWVPSGNSSGCSGVSDRTGPSAVYLNADASNGGLAMYTSAGPRSDGKSAFFQQYQSTGQDGNGTNANIVGTYLAFRQTWRSNPTVQPFLGSSATARVMVKQSVASATLGSSSGTLAQTQQLVSLHLINNTCRVEGITTGRPCQMNYLFNTAIMRNNVSDWSSVSWAQTVRVWYDAAQGGIPIIEGQLKSQGTASNDSENGLPMFTSQGYATQHSTFSPLSFDVRISMAQLTNALRILTGKALGIAPSAVTADQLTTMWSADWNNPSAWVAESVTAAQEISSADRNRAVEIAGFVRQLYVGPAPN